MLYLVFNWGSERETFATVNGSRYIFNSELGAVYDSRGDLLGVLRTYIRVTDGPNGALQGG